MERFKKLFCDKSFLCIFSSSQVNCLWVLAMKNNPSGAAFNLTRFKIFSEGLSFLCISACCGQMKEWLFGMARFSIIDLLMAGLELRNSPNNSTIST